MFAALVLMSQRPVAQDLERIRAHYGLPSICAGAIVDGKIVALDAVGVRRLGSDDRATVTDLYHLGSNTKAFTSTLAALMVQRGKLRWDAPLSDLLPEVGEPFRAVTPLLLAQHRAGLTDETYTEAMPDWHASREPLPKQRAEYARLALAAPPALPPGTAFRYSNQGYVVLGALLERLTGRSWEDLATAELLKPLGLRSAGFGPVPEGNPVGHVERDGKLVPLPGLDNAPVVGPAGTLHMSVPDMLKWCAFQADEGRRGGSLRPEAFRALHTPPAGSDYAGGFLAVDRDWAGGRALTHSGSNTANYQTLWIAPAKRFAVVVATNAAPEDVHAAVDEACGLLIAHFCPR